MDVLILSGILHLLFSGTEAINCHDCTSWSPYCRESVALPFPSAVATSECVKTDTCYLKKEENGVITRGCADWWMSSQVDIHYIGCQTQEVPWMGKQTWCFCQDDYCNGGTIDEIENGIMHRAPELHDERGVQTVGTTSSLLATANAWNNDWDSIDWNQWTWNDDTRAWESSEMNDFSNIKEEGPTTKQNEFNDFEKEQEQEVKSQSADPAWNRWYWHADSDRPQWPTEQAVDQTTEAAPAAIAEGVDSTTQIIQKIGSPAASTDSAEWGEGWEQLLPWWEGNFHQATTMPPVVAGGPKEINAIEQHDQDGDDPSQVIDNIPEVDWTEDNNIPNIDNEVDISASEFFCWDCYSDSPLCGETVDSTKAHYLGKTACPTTNKCFVRYDGDVTYRGCADGWIGSVVNHNYVGCEIQELWGKEVEWCFCTASFCNGDSMMDIQEKYLHSEPEIYKGAVYNTSTEVHGKSGDVSANSVRTTRSVGNHTAQITSKAKNEQTTVQMASSKTTSNVQKITSSHRTTQSRKTAIENHQTTNIENTTKTIEADTTSSTGTQTTATSIASNQNGTTQNVPKGGETTFKKSVGNAATQNTESTTSTTGKAATTKTATDETTDQKTAAKSQTTKATIRKRESGLEYVFKSDDHKKQTKLFQALIGK